MLRERQGLAGLTTFFLLFLVGCASSPLGQREKILLQGDEEIVLHWDPSPGRYRLTESWDVSGMAVFADAEDVANEKAQFAAEKTLVWRIDISEKNQNRDRRIVARLVSINLGGNQNSELPMDEQDKDFAQIASLFMGADLVMTVDESSEVVGVSGLSDVLSELMKAMPSVPSLDDEEKIAVATKKAAAVRDFLPNIDYIATPGEYLAWWLPEGPVRVGQSWQAQRPLVKRKEKVPLLEDARGPDLFDSAFQVIEERSAGTPPPLLAVWGASGEQVVIVGHQDLLVHGPHLLTYQDKTVEREGALLNASVSMVASANVNVRAGFPGSSSVLGSVTMSLRPCFDDDSEGLIAFSLSVLAETTVEPWEGAEDGTNEPEAAPDSQPARP